ncbi:MAG: PAS domain-containing protein [bacterium]|nr:PAS domain-containing protein [bacterium]
MIFKKDTFRQIRQKNRWSLASLAKESGISRRSLILWESGERIPTEKSIRNLAAFLNIQVDSISDLPPAQKISEKDISKSANIIFELSQKTTQDSSYKEIIHHAAILNSKMEQAAIIIRGFLTSLHSIFYIKDVNLKYIVVNDSFLKYLSLSSSYNITGKTDNDFFTLKEAKLNHEQDKTVLQTGIEVKELEQYIPGSRKKKWGVISKLTIKDNENKIIGILGVFLDITEKKEIEKIRELLEIHIGAMSASVSISRSNFTKYLYLNKGHEKIYGYSNDKFYKHAQDFWLSNCVHPDDREFEREYIRTKSWPSKYEYRIIKPGGEIRWIESQVTSEIKYQNQECIISVDTDITERISTSAKRIMLENAISKIDDGIIISEVQNKHDNKPIIKYINEALKKIVGISDFEFFKKSSIHSLSLPAYQKELKKMLINPIYPLTFEYDIKRVNDGKIITISEKIFNYSDRMYLSVIRNITSSVKEKEIRTLIEDSLKDSRDVLWVREVDSNKLIYVSESVTKLTGFPIKCFKKEINFWRNNCVHPEDRTAYKKNLFNNVWPRTLRYRIIDTSGNIKWIQTILFYKSKEDKIYRSVDRDITKQIKAEQEKQNQIRIEIAEKMRKHNVDPLIIADTTGLTNEVINNLN